MTRTTGSVVLLAVLVCIGGCGQQQRKAEPATPDQVVLKVPGMT